MSHGMSGSAQALSDTMSMGARALHGASNVVKDPSQIPAVDAAQKMYHDPSSMLLPEHGDPKHGDPKHGAHDCQHMMKQCDAHWDSHDKTKYDDCMSNYRNLCD